MNPGMSPRVAVVPIIGPDGAGKTSLHQALASQVARHGGMAYPPMRAVSVAGTNVNVLDVPTAWGYLQIADFPSAQCEPMLVGNPQAAAALLVVSATDSVLPGTWDSLQNAKQGHVPRVAVALSKCDLVEDPEMLDLVTMEIRETLSKHGFDGDAAPVLAVTTMPQEPRGHGGSPIVPLSSVVEALSRFAV
jgi:elongation factor Tu